MMTSTPVLGILGGLGPLCGARFYEQVILSTDASCDRDHIPVLLDGQTHTPDRTAFLCGQSQNDPFPVLLSRAQGLIENGASLLALPCNTAHSFYRQLTARISVPLLHIIAETVAVLCERQTRCVGILCTDGTRHARLYDAFCAPVGIRCIYLPPHLQSTLEYLIYHRLKAGRNVSKEALSPFCAALRAAGATHIVTACTELSLCGAAAQDSRIVDSLTVLASRTVLACGKRLRQKERFA